MPVFGAWRFGMIQGELGEFRTMRHWRPIRGLLSGSQKIAWELGIVRCLIPDHLHGYRTQKIKVKGLNLNIVPMQ